MKHLAGSDGVVRLNKFEKLEVPSKEYDPAHVVVCACLDTETTGLNPTQDDIIEIAICVVAFDVRTGLIVDILDEYASLNDPGRPIPPEASATHGIYDAHVKGYKIDWDRVAEILSSVDFVIAFNANFDCKFVQAAYHKAGGTAPEALWVCALNQVKWTDVPARKLEIIAAWNGYWYDAHRAMVDVHMTLKLLDAKCSLPNLYYLADKPTYEVQVTGGPRDEKSLSKLKTPERRFEWDKTRTMWWRVASTKEEAVALVRYLDDYYDGRNQCAVREINPKSRYGFINEYGRDMRKEWGV